MVVLNKPVAGTAEKFSEGDAFVLCFCLIDNEEYQTCPLSLKTL